MIYTLQSTPCKQNKLLDAGQVKVECMFTFQIYSVEKQNYQEPSETFGFSNMNKGLLTYKTKQKPKETKKQTNEKSA